MAGQDVEDPYFGGPEGFEVTWHQVSEAAQNLVEALLQERN